MLYKGIPHKTQFLLFYFFIIISGMIRWMWGISNKHKIHMSLLSLVPFVLGRYKTALRQEWVMIVWVMGHNCTVVSFKFWFAFC